MLLANGGFQIRKLNTLLRRARNSIELRNLVKGTAGALVVKALGALAGFALSVMLARFLGADQAGVYYTALQFVVLGAFIGRLALDLPIMRETASALEKDTAAYWSTVRHIGVISAIGTALVAIGIIAASGIIAEFFQQEELAWLLPVWAVALAATAFFNLFSQAVRGTGRIWESSYFLFASVNIIAATFLAAAWVIHSETSWWTPLQAAVAGYLVATTLTAIGSGIRAWIALRNADSAASDKFQSATYKDLLQSGGSFVVYGLCTRGLAWGTVLILAAFHSSSQVAIYSSAYQITLVVGFMLKAIVSAVGPRFMKIYHSGDIARLRRLFVVATGFTLTLSIPMVAILFLYSEQIMGMYGREFIQGAVAVNVLLLGQLVSAAMGPAAQILIAAKRERLLRNISLAGLVINLALQVSIVPPFGFLGSAIATSVTIVFLNVVIVVLVWRLLGSNQPRAEEI